MAEVIARMQAGYRCENCRQPFQTLGSVSVHRRYCPAARVERANSRETVASSSSGSDTFSVESSEHQPSREFSNVSSILDSLALSENPMSAIGELTDTSVCQLAGENRLQDVKRLWMVDAGLSQIRGTPRWDVSGMGSLVELSLMSNYLQNLGDIVTLPSLRILRLDHNQLSSLAGIQSLSKLEVLSLSHNAITSIHNFPHFPCLQELHVAHNQLTSEFDARTALQKQPSLNVASVEGNPFMLRDSHMRYRLLHSLHLAWLDSEEVTLLDYSIGLSVQIGASEPSRRLSPHFTKLAHLLSHELLSDPEVSPLLIQLQAKLNSRFTEKLQQLAVAVLKRHNL